MLLYMYVLEGFALTKPAVSSLFYPIELRTRVTLLQTPSQTSRSESSLRAFVYRQARLTFELIPLSKRGRIPRWLLLLPQSGHRSMKVKLAAD